MATHSSILAWEIPWAEEPGRLQSMGSQKSIGRAEPGTRRAPKELFPNQAKAGVSDGWALQCSCLENPRDSGAWWAAVSGVSQSRT